MPAQAGIQGHIALAAGEASWIPGLALLARNDGDANSLRVSCAQYLEPTNKTSIAPVRTAEEQERWQNHYCRMSCGL